MNLNSTQLLELAIKTQVLNNALEKFLEARNVFNALKNKFQKGEISRKTNLIQFEEENIKLVNLRNQMIDSEVSLTNLFSMEFRSLIIKIRNSYYEDKKAFLKQIKIKANLEVLFSILMFFVFENNKEELKRFYNSSSQEIKSILSYGDAYWAVLIESK